MSRPSQHRHRKYLATAFGFVLIFAVIIVVFFIFPKPFAKAQTYPIQGFDVSHHQGNIQWNKISPNKYKFVYLKATEGGDYQDSKFQNYWLQAREQGFLVGAYHFYRLCRKGDIQAQNFIQNVPNKADALPPVIDLEYDSKCIHHFTREQLLKEIQIMHDRLYQHYGKQPIFYVSKSFYNIVLAGHFQKTPLWVREYNGEPQLKNNPKWLFWQRTNQGKIQGIQTSVDLNLFHGDKNAWNEFLEKNQIRHSSGKSE